MAGFNDSEAAFISQFEHTPVTALTCILIFVIWFALWNGRVGPEVVCVSYKRVVQDREYWRVVTATLSHLEVMHLVFNMITLWSSRIAELAFGSWYFLVQSVALMIASEAISLLITYILVNKFQQRRHHDQLSLGYSAVLFGWMTIISVKTSSTTSILGVFTIPSGMAPFVSLLITQLIVRNASFVGHFSGILAGYLSLLGVFDWLEKPYWAVCVTFWITLALITSLKETTEVPIPCIDYINLRGEPEVEEEVPEENGHLTREAEATLV